jgi:glycosyltransferase involved in cell wall biosynthesis
MTTRFPLVTETFILREMNGVAARGIDVEVLSLFSADPPFVHELAKPWMGRRHRPRAGMVARGSLWALLSRPREVGRAVAMVVRTHRSNPGRLARALVTLPLAAAQARRMQDLGVDHIHAHYATYPALSAWFCSRLTGISYSFTAHAHDIFVDHFGLSELIADASFVVTISEYNRVLLSRFGEGSDTPIHVVRCGVDLARYRWQQKRIPSAGAVRAVCVASLQEYKGHRVLFEALALGGPRLQRIHLKLIGDGYLRESLERLARRLKIDDRVEFAGPLSEYAVTEELADADLFVLASTVQGDGQMDGLPVALIEALACGTPAIGTALSGIPELARGGLSCLLATPGDPVSLAAALEFAVDEPGASSARAAEGRKVIEEGFDIEGSVDAMPALVELAERTAGSSTVG